MNILSAVIAGVVASLVFSIVLGVAPKMGMPKMDIVSLLASMFSPRSNPVQGWMMHLMMGIVFALMYALLWSSGIGAPTWLGGLIFGAVHWLIVGMVMGMIPIMHVGIKSGTVQAPGLWMTNHGGFMAFMGGLIGHMIFGAVIAVVYAAL
ncbi:MAG: hypothetical protein L0287_22535 [Anaerolineae bacterium]|nr:hypothetical protein [Anaerolineae bacterium]MCI0609155.1 hypothetical protein [Anaerolineae bacterium]